MSGWYAVTVAPQAERRVAYALSGNGFAVFLPMETDWGRKGEKIDKTRQVYTPLLRGYIFVLVQEDLAQERDRFGEVLKVEGALGFVDFIDEAGETRPSPIPTAAIIEMQADERAGRYDLTLGRTPAPPPPYRPKKGEQVQVIAGAYLTFVGEVLAAPKKNRVRIRLPDGREPELKVSHLKAAS